MALLPEGKGAKAGERFSRVEAVTTPRLWYLKGESGPLRKTHKITLVRGGQSRDSTPPVWAKGTASQGTAPPCMGTASQGTAPPPASQGTAPPGVGPGNLPVKGQRPMCGSRGTCQSRGSTPWCGSRRVLPVKGQHQGGGLPIKGQHPLCGSRKQSENSVRMLP